MGTSSQNPDVCSYWMCYKHFPNSLQGALSIWISEQVNFPQNILLGEVLHHRVPLALLSCALFFLFPFEVETVFIFKVDRMKMKGTVKNPARRDFSTLISAYIIKTSKLSFHGMFPFFLETLLINDVIFEALLHSCWKPEISIPCTTRDTDAK